MEKQRHDNYFLYLWHLGTVLLTNEPHFFFLENTTKRQGRRETESSKWKEVR